MTLDNSNNDSTFLMRIRRMTVRVYRKRLGLIGVFLISIGIYFNRKNSIVREEVVEIQGGKIDWHDYVFIKRENTRRGFGESGAGVESTLEERNTEEYHELYRANGFNAFLSDRIALDRSLNDLRHPQCKSKLYLAELPSVSVIIPVYNEHLTTLFRSIYSLLNRTPARLLEEILLVDDGSDQVVMNISHLNKTRLVRLEKHQGLIQARLAGARLAKGDILIFLHSHIEVNVNWLPPLIEPIVLNSKTVVCPFIDVIKSENLAYVAEDEGSRGVFDWSMSYKRLPVLSLQIENLTEPFENPVMAGEVFAIHKKWFWELEGFDEGLEGSSGEQYEMSFKIWQCGGRILDAPCSRIGHIYRQFNLPGTRSTDDRLSKNLKRIATIWMDEYAEHVYKQNPHLRNIDPGDVKKQVQLRDKLQCQSFKWYMESVASDLLQHYPVNPPPSFAEGEIRSMAAPLCIDTKHGVEQAKFGLDHCVTDQQGRTGEQQFELTWRQDIRPKGRNICFDVSPLEQHPSLILYNCHGIRGNQHFVYDIDHFHLLHIASQLCLDCDVENKILLMEQCDVHSQTQQWKFSSYNKTLILREMKELF